MIEDSDNDGAVARNEVCQEICLLKSHGRSTVKKDQKYVRSLVQVLAHFETCYGVLRVKICREDAHLSIVNLNSSSI